MRETLNKVQIEGVLSEINLEETVDSRNQEVIRGNVKVKVRQPFMDKVETSEITIPLYANKYKKGTMEISKIFENYSNLMADGMSIASTGDELTASRIRCNKDYTRLTESYYNTDKGLVVNHDLKASFINILNPNAKYNPTATFEVEAVIYDKHYVLDDEGMETEEYEVIAILPKYNNEVDVVPFKVYDKEAIDVIESNWEEGSTVSFAGVIRCASSQTVKVKQWGFGGATKEVTDGKAKLEYIITSGDEFPVDGDFAFDQNEIRSALEVRKQKMDQKRTEVKAKKPAAKGSASPMNQLKNLGF